MALHHHAIRRNAILRGLGLPDEMRQEGRRAVAYRFVPRTGAGDELRHPVLSPASLSFDKNKEERG